MRLRFSLIIFIALLCSVLYTRAQSCTGSFGAPVVNETFGSGPTEQGPPLPAGVTTYRFLEAPCGLEDGQYSIASSMRSTSCKGGTWQAILNDHTYESTGDPTGYMMIVNAALDPGVFYTKRVSGSSLCPGTTYEFKAYIMNILRLIPNQTDKFVKPNITFRIETPDGKLLAPEYNTGDIDALPYPKWLPYSTTFVSDGSDVVVKMINNSSGSDGNDLALDDITFSPCGAMVQSGFNTIAASADDETQKACANDNLNYTLVSRQTGYTNPTYKWQQNINNSGWIDIEGATGPTLPLSLPHVAAGRYLYHVGVLNGSQAGAESCRIYSDPLSIFVYNYITPVVDKATSACAGSPLQLSATGGLNGSYEWTGPNGYSATGDSPVVTQIADKSFEGVYSVKITTNGCPSFANTTVKVYDAPLLNPITVHPICEGSSIQLVASGTNITHYKWTPSYGLDHDDIANPIASPAVTTNYQVEVYNDGCDNRPSSPPITVTVWAKPQADAGQTIKMFEGQTVRLKGVVKGDNVTSYWSPPDFLDDPTSPIPHTSATSDITYTLHVVSSTGCGEATSSVFVRVYKKLGIPNTFTPNGDGKNDQWNITNLQTYPNAAVSIYNRSGQQVFQSNGYSVPWGGTYNGSPLPVGTYYYIIDLREDNLDKQSGWLFIAR
ncbi:gliding motility-associated C-terminal domain-containing protein [Mucilaginibacter agri]|uniref:T9SS type B sorting domain-containing protein n=1 Tax=Mucilaginibacter agri TaxID=2695265 RepID=A0A966DS78_9SPHI|nr:gliding motility-associated C-terminal domain-containing protein [Mucilaginibacter agri]NCD69295.1 T9SS type B sorting domain-containing protein [Mucilaginibacter agri]